LKLEPQHLRDSGANDHQGEEEPEKLIAARETGVRSVHPVLAEMLRHDCLATGEVQNGRQLKKSR
jgi:hypothetical protein